MNWSRGSPRSPSPSVHGGDISISDSTSPSSEPQSFTRKKRKGSPYNHGTSPTYKRAKQMGRPRNGWTPTRKRKLVRLYLLTDLEVAEIVEVLRAHDFQPCKRDVQKQLNTLLQSRPNKVRSKGHVARARLQLLRECKTEQTKKREVIEMTNDPPHSNSPTSGDSEVPPPVLTEHLGHPWKDSKTERSISTSSSTSTSSEEHQHESPIKDFSSEAPSPHVPQLMAHSPEPGPMSPTDPGDSKSKPEECRISISSSSNHVSSRKADSIFSRRTAKGVAVGNILDSESIMSSGKDSTRSILSLRSLKRRLLSKYSTSHLGEIKSLLDRLTISEKSDASSIRTGRPHGAISSRLSVPTKWEYPVILPGIFPQYCWEHINQDQLVRCDDIRLPCNRGPIFKPSPKETRKSIGTEVLFRIRNNQVRKDDLESFDVFGNTVLHIAATLGSPLRYLSCLISMGANVHSRNNANQTFLHLVHMSESTNLDDFRFLLGSLVRRQFNFQQQDHNGQTCIHALTQFPLTLNILSRMIAEFHAHGVTLPTSRDNLGFTVMDQLQDKGFRIPLPEQGLPQTLKAMRINMSDDQSVKTDETLEENSMSGKSVCNFEKRASIKNLEDLQQYELHADLLRSILRAGDDPLFEDADGRNGLHCLAEVRLDLPLPNSSNQHTSVLQDQCSLTSRERYLEQLLLGGVDPNSCDKHGATPFMAFIIHRREGEDDILTTQLMERLHKAGADIHRRNRHGETALHLAVKLGHRAATRFLITRGANLHARTSNGTGILALGLKYSSRAAYDEILYAQISLCICLAGTAGAAAAPTILHEWACADFKSIPERRPSVVRFSNK